jgi:hypothetical protein
MQFNGLGHVVARQKILGHENLALNPTDFWGVLWAFRPA